MSQLLSDDRKRRAIIQTCETTSVPGERILRVLCTSSDVPALQSHIEAFKRLIDEAKASPKFLPQAFPTHWDGRGNFAVDMGGNVWLIDGCQMTMVTEREMAKDAIPYGDYQARAKALDDANARAFARTHGTSLKPLVATQELLNHEKSGDA